MISARRLRACSVRVVCLRRLGLGSSFGCSERESYRVQAFGVYSRL